MKRRKWISAILVMMLAISQLAPSVVVAEDQTEKQLTTASEQADVTKDAEAEEKAKAEAEAKAKAEAEAKAKAEAEAKAKAEAEAKAKAEAEAKAKAEEEARAKAEAEKKKTEEQEASKEKSQSGEKENSDSASDNAQKEEDEAQNDKEDVEDAEDAVYQFTVEVPSVNGTVKVMTSAGTTDAGALYSQEIKEGENVQLQVKANEGYAIDAVQANGTALSPAEVSGDDTYLYKLENIAADTKVIITYKEAAEDEDKDKENEEEEKAEMPAQTLTTTAADGAVITVKAAEGTFEEGASVNAEVVSAKAVEGAIEQTLGEKQEIEDTAAYDITITDKDGNEIQPEKSVSVSIAGAGVKGDAVAVYHVAGSSAEKVAGGQSANSAAFTAEHFSIYVVVGTGTAQTEKNVTGGSYTIEEGETIRVTCDSEHSHSWTSDDSGIATVTTDRSRIWPFGQKNEQTVTGVSKGTATISCGGTSFDITVTAKKYTVTFNLNGGSGAAPASITAEAGSLVTMPSYNGTNGNKEFVGWSLIRNANADGNYKPGNNGTVYPAGSTSFNMPNGNVTLYATWSDKDVDAQFFIRLDGTIPTEPQGHEASEYTSAINISDAIKVATFYTDSTAGVSGRLNKVPTDAQIKRVYPSYNPDTQYVLWYVIKPESTWHVDGVLLNKEKVNLSYNANAPEGTWSNMPDGRQYNVNDQVTVSSKVPTRTGYTFTGWNTKADGTGTAYSGGNTFTITEDTTLYAQWKANSTTAYKVEYYLEDPNNLGNFVRNDDATINGTGQTGAAVTAPAKTFQGYTFDEDNANNVLTGNIKGDGSLVLKRYYEVNKNATKTLEYTVEYYKDNEKVDEDSYTETKDVWVNDPDKIAIKEAIDVRNDKYVGYKLDSNKTGTVPAKGTEVDTETVIKIYYVKDTTQQKELKYTVEYYKDNQLVTDDSYTETTKVWVNDPDKITIKADIDVADDKYVGYKLSKTEPSEVPAAGTKVDTETVIKIYYVKDDSQTQETKYTVKHVVGGQEMTEDTRTYTGTAWINDENPMIAIVDGSVTPKEYTGYKYASTTPDVQAGDSVASGSEIILTYVKDEEQVKTLSYTVKYTLEGVEQKDFTKTYTETVWVNDDDNLAVQKGSIDQLDFQGYKFDSITPEVEVGTEVVSGSTITLNYVKDEEQTKTVSYRVEYYKDKVLVDEDSYTKTKTVWVNDPDEIAIENDIDVSEKKYVGYKLDSTEPEQVPAEGDKVGTGTVIKIYYVKDDSQTQETKYTVKHVVGGQEMTADTRTYTGTAWINDENPTIIVKTGSLAKNTYEGYKFDSIDPSDAKEGNTVASGSTITLNYVKDEEQTKTVSYRVEYYKDNVLVDKDSYTKTKTIWVNDPDEIAIAETIDFSNNKYVGYKLDSTDPKQVPAEGDKVGSGTVIKIYYVKDDSQTQATSYTVKHVVDGKEMTEDTRTYTGTAWINEENPTIIVKTGSLAKNTYEGYKFDSIDPSDAKEGNAVASGSTIILNYVKDEEQTKPVSYRVEYYKDKVLVDEDSYTKTKTVWVNDPDEIAIENDIDVSEKKYVGYKLDSTDPEQVPAEGDKVGTGTVIKIYYVKDDSQTQATSYTVKHVVDGKEMTEDTRTYTGTAWINDENPMITIEAGSVDAKKYEGYKYASTTPDVKAGDSVTSGSEIILTYVKDDDQVKPLSYTVKYTLEGVEQEDFTKTYTKTVWVNEDDNLAVQEGSIDQLNFQGYKFDSITPKVEVGTEVASGSTITLNYVKDEEQTRTISYTVEYYKNNSLVEGDTQTVTNDKVWINDSTAPVDKAAINTTDKYPGYHFVKTEPAEIPAVIADNGVIKVYYEANTDTEYTVEYYYEEDGVYPETATKSVTRTGTTDTEATVTDEDKVSERENYNFDENADNILSDIIAADGSTVLRLYFSEDRYYYEGTVNVSKAVYEDHEESNSNETFYAGIFEDAACTTPVVNADGEAAIIPLEMSGGFLVSVEMNIPMTEEGQQWYVTEVDVNGTPVQATDNFEFTVNGVQNGVAAITVDKEGTTQVALQNDYYSDVEQFYKGEEENNGGEKVISEKSKTTVSTEQNKTTVTADSNGGKDAQANNSASAVQTGDTGSVMPFVLASAIAALIALLALFRRKPEEDK